VRVKGKLRPSPPDARLCALSGDVEFVASGELPQILRAAPEPALRAAARAMSRRAAAGRAQLLAKGGPIRRMQRPAELVPIGIWSVYGPCMVRDIRFGRGVGARIIGIRVT